jgi:hypothetical protein
MGTTIPSGSALNLLVARKGVTGEAELSTFITLLSGDGDDYAFPILDREGVKAGDSVEIRLEAVRDDSDLFGPNAQILGNEKSLQFYKDTMAMRYLSVPYAIENVDFDQQMVPINLRKRSMKAIGKIWRYRREAMVINQLAGNLAANTETGEFGGTYERVGGNALASYGGVGIDSGHIIRAGAEANDTDVGTDANNIMEIDLIQEAVTRASSNSYAGQKVAIAPCRTPWGELYVCIMKGTQFRQLMTYATTNEFTMIEQAKIQGGMPAEVSAYISGPGAIYDRTLLLVSDFIPQGIAGGAAVANTRRAIFFGAQAGHWLYGEGHTEGDHLGYSEHMVHRRWSAQADSVFGFKGTEISELAERWASFVITTYSAV